MSANQNRTRNVSAAIIGNTIEWFDILVYAYFVTEIATNFFPSTSGTSSLMLAFAAFGLSFIARPLGAIVLGRISDKSGRQVALVYASGLMFIGTLGIAILPTYEAIGIAAPILLIVMRLIQGFSVGGEFGSAAAYLAEQSKSRRAFYSSLQFASQGLGMLFAALCGLVLGLLIPPEGMTEWGWRIPFLIGAALGPVAYYIRLKADETPEFKAAKASGHIDVAQSSADFIMRCAVGTGAVLACSVSIYFLVYIPTFAQVNLGADQTIAYSTALVSGATLLFGAPLAGLLADKIGALKHGILSAIFISLTAYPIFSVMISGDSELSILLGQFGLSIGAALYVGSLPAILAGLFDTRNRSLGLAVSYNLSVMTAGGFAQLIFVLLISWTGLDVAPSFYVVLAALASVLSLFVCVWIAKKDKQNALSREVNASPLHSHG